MGSRFNFSNSGKGLPPIRSINMPHRTTQFGMGMPKLTGSSSGPRGRGLPPMRSSLGRGSKAMPRSRNFASDSSGIANNASGIPSIGPKSYHVSSTGGGGASGIPSVNQGQSSVVPDSSVNSPGTFDAASKSNSLGMPSMGRPIKSGMSSGGKSNSLGMPSMGKIKGSTSNNFASSAHPGFSATQRKIEKSGYSSRAAAAILASSTRKASGKAHENNPRLNRVKG